MDEVNLYEKKRLPKKREYPVILNRGPRTIEICRDFHLGQSGISKPFAFRLTSDPVV